MAVLNYQRLKFLLAIIWAIGVAAFYWTPIIDGWTSAREFAEWVAMLDQERRYDECLWSLGTSRQKVAATYSAECGDGIVGNICLKTKVPKCADVWFATTTSSLSPSLKQEVGNFFGALGPYFRHAGSNPLFSALAVLFGFPLLLLLAQKAFIAVKHWLYS